MKRKRVYSKDKIMKTIAISAVCLLVLAASFGLTGCADPYGPVGYGGPGYYGNGYYNSGYYGPNYYASGYYGPRYYRTGYYGSPYHNTGYYGSGYYPGYASTGYMSIAVGDRPYYTHGTGYWVGPRYYTWHHGYWGRHHGHRAWVHGYYVIRS
jgi:hypothetical protein